MKQVLQNRKMGKASVIDVPVPVLQPGRLLVRTAASLISAGTERAAVESVQKNLVAEARDRPDLVRTVINKARDEGILNTLGKVREKLATSQALGYSAAGTVIDVAPDVTEFRIGDRVACAGLGFASHAEVLSVPKNLCVRLPRTLDFQGGAFGTVGAIALQGVRLAEPTLGEFVVVIGLGLIGQLTAQLLKANGCRVFGIDVDQSRIDLARELGAEDGCLADGAAGEAVAAWSRGRGADAVLITAATNNNEPVELAGAISRLKGRVIVVGLTGLNVPRQEFYRRELSLKISLSYGPGRYDPDYEQRGHDYPFAYVRWTENRNIEAFLDLVARGAVDVQRLISHRFPIEQAEQAFQLITGTEPHLALLLEYDQQAELTHNVVLVERGEPSAERAAERSAEPGDHAAVRVGLIGAGDYVRAMLLPHLKNAGAEFLSIATASGVAAHDVGRKYGFARAVSGGAEVISDPDVNLVVIGTRHDSHAELAQRALAEGRHVFVEKPLALNDLELENVMAAAKESRAALMVGFNRRFSPLAREAKEFFAGSQGPLSILYRVNAGRVPPDHWLQDHQEGGGRIVGEVCHFVDLMQYLIGAPPVTVFAESVNSNDAQVLNEDSVFVTLGFADGSNGCIAYVAEGDKSLAKERVEIFGSGKTFVIDDFRTGSSHAAGRERQTRLRSKDKGQADYMRSVCSVVKEGLAAPITLEELEATSRATFRILDSLRSRERVPI